MDIDTRSSTRVKQVVDGALEPITFNDIFKALLPEGYEVTDIAQAIQSLVEDEQHDIYRDEHPAVTGGVIIHNLFIRSC
jgi:hypothetical protein